MSINLVQNPSAFAPDQQEEEGQLSPFRRLPTELIERMLTYLNFRDLVAMSQTNRRFSKLCRMDSLWRRLYAHYFMPLSSYTYKAIFDQDTVLMPYVPDSKLAFRDAYYGHHKRLEKEAEDREQQRAEQEAMRWGRYFRAFVAFYQGIVVSLLCGIIPLTLTVLLGQYLDDKAGKIGDVFGPFLIFSPLLLLSALLAVWGTAWGTDESYDRSHLPKTHIWHGFKGSESLFGAIFQAGRRESDYDSKAYAIFRTTYLLLMVVCFLLIPFGLWAYVESPDDSPSASFGPSPFPHTDQFAVGLLPFWLFSGLLVGLPLALFSVFEYEENFAVYYLFLAASLGPFLVGGILLSVYLDSSSNHGGVGLYGIFLPFFLLEALGALGCTIFTIFTIVELIRDRDPEVGLAVLFWVAYVIILGPFLLSKIFVMIKVGAIAGASLSFSYMTAFIPVIIFFSITLVASMFIAYLSSDPISRYLEGGYADDYDYY